VGGLSRRGVRVVPPASVAAVSFGLPDERDFVGMARGWVRGVEAGRDGTELALLLRWGGGGGAGDEEALPSKTEFPKEEPLLDTTALMLSSSALTSGGTGI